MYIKLKLAIVACLIVFLWSCQTEKKGYVIEGTVSNLKTDSLFFYDELDWLSPNTIKVPVVDGKFRIEGYCDEAKRIKVWGDKPSPTALPHDVGAFFLGNYNYTMEISKTEFKVNTDNPDQIVYAELEGIKDRDEAIEAVKKHLDSPAAVNFYYYNKARYDDNIVEMANSFTGRAKKSTEYQRLDNLVYAKTGIKKGMPARDMTIYGLDGKPRQLIEKNGKPTLVYVYMPEGNEHYPYSRIKKVYEKYKSSPINFIGFSRHVRDQQWISDADFCEIPFPVYGGTDDKVNRIDNIYGIRISPSILLVDKNGDIITCAPYHKIGNLDELIQNAL